MKLYWFIILAYLATIAFTTVTFIKEIGGNNASIRVRVSVHLRFLLK